MSFMFLEKQIAKLENRENNLLDTKINKLNNQINSMQLEMDNLNQTSKHISNMITQFEVSLNNKIKYIKFKILKK